MVGVVGQNQSNRAISTMQIVRNKIHSKLDRKLLSKVCDQIECRINGKEKAKMKGSVIKMFKCKAKTTFAKKKYESKVTIKETVLAEEKS
jgi:hypothetical protein